MPDDRDRDLPSPQRVVEVQNLLVTALALAGCTNTEVAAAAMLTAAMIFATSRDGQEAKAGFLASNLKAWDWVTALLAERQATATADPADPAGLAQREPQGGIS